MNKGVGKTFRLGLRLYFRQLLLADKCIIRLRCFNWVWFVIVAVVFTQPGISKYKGASLKQNIDIVFANFRISQSWLFTLKTDNTDRSLPFLRCFIIVLYAVSHFAEVKHHDIVLCRCERSHGFRGTRTPISAAALLWLLMRSSSVPPIGYPAKPHQLASLR